MIKLIFENDVFDFERERVFETSLLTVGRSGSCMFSIDHPSVSRRHFLLEFFDNTWFITDEGSTMGTVLDGQILTPKKAFKISSGQKICIGDFLMTFEWDNLKPKEEHTMVIARKLMEGFFIESDESLENLPHIFDKDSPPIPENQSKSIDQISEEIPIRSALPKIFEKMPTILDGMFLVLFFITIGAMSLWLMH